MLSQRVISANKIQGVIYGQALGDALGLATEFMGPEQVEATYADKLNENFEFSQIIQDAHRSIWAAGDWTDDTDLFLIGMKSYIDATKSNSYHAHVDTFRDNLDAWFSHGIPECGDSKPHGCGNTMKMIWGDPEFLHSTKTSAQRVYVYNPFNPCASASNGGVMRIGWIGASGLNFDEIAHLTIDNIALTHCDPRCIASGLFVNFLIGQLTNGFDKNQKPHDLFNQVIEQIKPYLDKYINQFNREMAIMATKLSTDPASSDEYRSVLLENFKHFRMSSTISVLYELECWVKKPIETNENTYGIGYTFLPVAWAAHSLVKAFEGKSFMSIIMDLVRAGGDADTNGAVTGAVLGAYFGYDNLPGHLIKQFPYGEYIKNLSDQFIELVQ